MAEKLIKTRIKLKYDSYANWESIWGSFVPMRGETCFFYIPDDTGAVVQEPTIMYKVGDGTTTLQALPWGSAIASDVYEWAKKQYLAWSDIDDNFKEELQTFVEEHSVSDVYRIKQYSESVFKLQKKDAKSEDIDANWHDVADPIDLTAALAKKVDKEITGDAGKAMIFNEADGGGAKFEYNDGTASYVGVHDKSNGVGAQIYVDKDATTGVIIDVTGDKAYYHKGEFGTAASRDIPANEIATIGDITGTVGGFEIVKRETAEEGYLSSYYLADHNHTQKGATINIPKDFLVKSAQIKTVEEDDKPYEGARVGDKYIDFVINVKEGTATDEHIYIPIKELVDPYNAGKNIVIGSDNKISLKDDFKAEVTGANGKSVVFNESDGGGSKFEGSNGKDTAYVGTHDNIGGKVGTQIYVDKAGTSESTIIDVTADGAFYTKGEVKPGTERDVEANEIATKGDVAEKLPVYNVTVEGEAGTYTGQANVPVYFDITPAADKVTVNSYSIGLNTTAEQTAQKFTMDVPCATSETAGLMSANDKQGLDFLGRVQAGNGIKLSTATTDAGNAPVINVSLSENSGLRFSAGTGKMLEVDDSLTWIFDCGDSTELI